jgi:hypothetical protein
MLILLMAGKLKPRLKWKIKKKKEFVRLSAQIVCTLQFLDDGVTFEIPLMRIWTFSIVTDYTNTTF